MSTSEQFKMAASIHELWASGPVPNQLVILGKGPSLDRWSCPPAGTVRIGINEVCETIGCHYVVTGGDPGDTSMEALRVPTMTVPLRWRDEGRSYWFNGRGYYYDIGRDFTDAGCRATAGQAIRIFGEWALRTEVSRIDLTMVGFDAWDNEVVGEQRYAKCIKRTIRPLRGLSPTYKCVNQNIEAAFDCHRAHGPQINVTWFHRSVSREASPEH